MNTYRRLDDFGVLILTHGRAKNIKTYNLLRKCGYTGKIYIVIDDTDSQYDEYVDLYGDQVVVFSKKDAMRVTDTYDNGTSKAAVVFARNYAHKVAGDLGLKYFLELDDDYTALVHTFDDSFKYMTKRPSIKNLDAICEAYLEFLDNSGALTVCFSQGGDFIGGESSGLSKKIVKGELSRKAMNAFFMKVDRPFKFGGRINEDVNAYVTLGSQGKLLCTVGQVRLEQGATQQNSGGLTDIYLERGTYVKSFYSVICAPSCVSLMSMGVKHNRIHHRVKWDNAVPKIISESFKKESTSMNRCK